MAQAIFSLEEIISSTFLGVRICLIELCLANFQHLIWNGNVATLAETTD
jgi:hypothetical protein